MRCDAEKLSGPIAESECGRNNSAAISQEEILEEDGRIEVLSDKWIALIQ